MVFSGTEWVTVAAPAQAAAEAAVAQAGGASPDVVVVGSRAGARRSVDSASPVDVVQGDALRARGFTDLSQVLQFLSPSFNFPPIATSPTSAGSRPAALRGLGPDQVLVLVNGKRWHAAATIVSNNGLGRGTVPVDFNTIPVASIERVEILRDGAAAQYGSDAIAGVINIVLKRAPGDHYVGLESGAATQGGGALEVFETRHGFDLGGRGAITVTGDVRFHDRTNAAGIDPHYGRVTQWLGAPRTLDGSAAVNGDYRLDFADLYGFATFDHRRAEMSPLFRAPTVAPSYYPDGFLPLVGETLTDAGGALGLKGVLAGWKWDVSDTLGYNEGLFDVSHSVNTSLGAASPTRFDAGGSNYFQSVTNLTLDRTFPLLSGLHVAVGGEFRYEHYAIERGDPDSYIGAGAQGFPGLNPPSPVDVGRHAVSGFIDTELSLTKALRLGLAGRYEDYSDFGDHVDGKASLFWRPIPLIAMRGTVSTGFRAPSLQQQYYSTVTSQLLLPQNVLANVGNFAVTDSVSQALGASPLEAERSRNYSAGLVLTPTPTLSFTADVFRVSITDRIALSENLTGAAVLRVLHAAGIDDASAVRFFTNAADTRTDGFELAGRWSGQAGHGRLGVSLGFAKFDTDLTRLKANPVLPSIPLLGLSSILVLIDGQPKDKLTANLSYDAGRWHLIADAVRFGTYNFPPLGPPQRFGPNATLDVSAAYDVRRTIRIQFGVINAFDAYPDKVFGQTDGRLYADSSGGLGFEGRQLYGKIAADF